MKKLFIAQEDVERYMLATHYVGSTWPKSFLLTLWQHFEVEELAEIEHFLVEQHIEVLQQIPLNTYYDCHLKRISNVKTTNGEIWEYQLAIYQNGLVAMCETKIYVR